MEMGSNYPSGMEETRPARAIDWMPLLIVIAAVSLATLSSTALLVSYYPYAGGDYSLDIEIGYVVTFLSFTAFAVTIALVVFSQLKAAKILLVVGIALMVVLLAIRTEIFLRAMMG